MAFYPASKIMTYESFLIALFAIVVALVLGVGGKIGPQLAVMARRALDALTLAKDGVDGKSIYLYGEGWDFGEVQGGKRGPNATQVNLFGQGIGTFNDRIRDAVRGGNPFDRAVRT